MFLLEVASVIFSFGEADLDNSLLEYDMAWMWCESKAQLFKAASQPEMTRLCTWSWMALWLGRFLAHVATFDSYISLCHCLWEIEVIWFRCWNCDYGCWKVAFQLLPLIFFCCFLIYVYLIWGCDGYKFYKLHVIFINKR